jgi:SAM-dependent methyltransferase
VTPPPSRPDGGLAGLLRRLDAWLVDAPARRPSGWIGRRRFGGERGAPRDHEPTFDRLLEQAGPLEGRRVLDVGCGGGRLLERVLDAGAAFAAGLDHSPDMVALAGERNRDAIERGVLQLALGDAESLPWPDGAFYVAFCANMLFFAERPQRMLGEIFRVLSPGGRLVLATVEGPLPRVTLRQWWVYVWGRAMHVHSDEQLRTMFEHAGFGGARVRSVNGLQLGFGVRPD